MKEIGSLARARGSVSGDLRDKPQPIDCIKSMQGEPDRGRQRPSGNWIMPIENPNNLVQQVLPDLACIDELKTSRTGIGKATMSIDPDDLQNVTNGAQLAAMSAAAL